MYYINDNTEVAVNDDGHYGLFRFDVDPDNYELTATKSVRPDDPVSPDNFGFWYGDGWNVYDVLSAGDYIYLANHDNGDLISYPMSDFLDKESGTWNKITVIQNNGDVVGHGFDDYMQMLVLNDSGSYYLLGVKSDGTLWAYAVSEGDGSIGDAKKIGSGWDAYVKLITTGDDILALDSSGDLYRYKDIDPSGTYKVKIND
jgi:hypothetical protein